MSAAQRRVHCNSWKLTALAEKYTDCGLFIRQRNGVSHLNPVLEYNAARYRPYGFCHRAERRNQRRGLRCWLRRVTHLAAVWFQQPRG